MTLDRPRHLGGGARRRSTPRSPRPTSSLDGAPAAYACCRPPGHHVTRTAYGGSCYLNNAAAAAARLRARAGGPVAVIDIDAHHGNGTQAIFYDRADVLTASVHVDPGAGWFPHFLGFADETGAGDGEGANRNLPLAPGAGDAEWLAGRRRRSPVGRGQRRRGRSSSRSASTPPPATRRARCRSRADGYRAAGRALGALGLPTVVVQEGGYDLTTIGALVRETLAGVEEGATRA